MGLGVTMSTTNVRPLCFRCEHRAYWLENHIAQKYECKDSDRAIVSCYMFKPTKPIALEKDPDEYGNILSPRLHSPAVDTKFKLSIKKQGEQTILYWEPVGE